ncbi:MAG: FAD-dependent oxidoreductase [Burkholderiaceae bacterium]|jgi:D-amino-acid dehydrogenase|nr:FAD-dependent oxidoreductase [Burkholderiaceae bacterium]
MHIAIIGAGIIGVTTAYELAEGGHAVTVFERHSSVAEEASFANAGIVAPGFVAPWRAPHWLRLFWSRSPAASRLTWPLSSADLTWLRRQRSAGMPAMRALGQAAMQRLATYSRERLHQITERLDYTFDRTEGILILLRTARNRERAQPTLVRLRDAGASCREISADEARQIEPALHPNTPLAGAIHVPDGEAGNCRQFAVIARDAAEQKGAQFVFNTSVIGIDPSYPASLWIAGETQPRGFDAVVLCTGAAASELLAPLGLRLPLASVYGYSISAPVDEPALAPRAAVFDGRIAIARLGQRVRVAGLAEIGGRHDNASTRAHALPAWAEQRLYRTLTDWFPAAARLTNGVQVWRGARPTLPDGPPALGASGLPGLWLNLGHGAHGWCMACGAARIVADLLEGHAPEIDLQGLEPERWR